MQYNKTTTSALAKGEDYQYYWSIGYMDNEGIKDGDAFSRFTTRLNLESNVSKYITVD